MCVYVHKPVALSRLWRSLNGVACVRCPAGASATDVNELGTTVNISSRVLAFGAGSVDTRVPTAPGALFSFVVEYQVRSNTAQYRRAAVMHLQHATCALLGTVIHFYLFLFA